MDWTGTGGASATGTITIDTIALAGAINTGVNSAFGSNVTALSITVAGASAGNGTFTLADFAEGWVFSATGTGANFGADLIGQANVTDINFFSGFFGDLPTGNVPNGTTFFEMTTAGGEVLTLSSFRPLALSSTHWLGQTDSNWNASNWASDAAGTATVARPSAADDITFSATGAAGQTSTNLDADFTINSLTVSSNAGINTTGAQRLTVTTTTTLDASLAVNAGVTILSNGIFTINSAGTLAGDGGTLNMGGMVNLVNDGTISVGDPTLGAPVASTLSITTSPVASIVMGASSLIVVDLFTGAGLGDNTAIATSSDRLNLMAKIDATLGGTLTIGNAGGLSGFLSGDAWQLFEGLFFINGTLTIDDSALNLGPTLRGSFDQSTGVYSLVAVPPLPATHWLGNGGTNWSSATWASDAGGTPTLATPTAADDVTFGAAGATNQTSTVLDANLTINSLTVNSATGILAPGGQRRLTVNNTTTLNAPTEVGLDISIASKGTFTIASTGSLLGRGSVAMEPGQNLVNNGAISVGDPNLMIPVASTFTLYTYDAGAVIMGAGSSILVDLFYGAGQGDNTNNPVASDRVSLVGTLDATAGGTIIIGNPLTLKGFENGDSWQLIKLNGGAGSITGTLGVNDSALHLTSTQTGNFNSTTGVYTVIDVKPGLEVASAQDQGVMSAMQGILGDLNGRLFNLRAGWGEEPQGSISDSLNGDANEGVIEGQGDGPEQPIAKRIPRSRQWEVFATINYANISLSSIRNQAGVDSQTWAPGAGLERHFTRYLTLGFAANLIETHQSYTGGLGNLEMEGVALSAYASYVRRSFWVDTLYSFGTFDLDTRRNATGFPVANGSTNAWTNAVQLNGGWSFRVPSWKLVHGPLAGVDWLHVNVDGYNETGGGIGALGYASRSVDSLITRVGWSVSKEFETSFAKITSQVRLTYERQNVDRNNGTSVNLINQPFTATTTSQAPGQDYMVAGAGVNFEFSQNFSMMLTYQGQFLRQDMQAHYGSARFTYKF